MSGGSPSAASRGYFLDPSDATGRTDSNRDEDFFLRPVQEGEITSSQGVTRRTTAPWAFAIARKALSGSDSV